MRNFRELEIWKESMDLTDGIYEILDGFPNHERYDLASQMKRCCISIPSNIAEGCRGSNKELVHFLNISLGSSYELETQIEIAHRQNYIIKEKFLITIERLNILQRRINSFRSYLKKDLKP